LEITVRKANEEDYETVLNLIKELAAFQKSLHKVTYTVEQMKEDKGNFHAFLAENENGEAIGVAFYFFAYFSWIGKSLYLDDLYVKESCRGQKVGSKLLNALFETARLENCKRVRWQVSDWNKPALEFYEKCGAEIDREQYNCDFEHKKITEFKLKY
jgi:GNAT superfamily N-acetyltransferase